jgi:hypothetical protein
LQGLRYVLLPGGAVALEKAEDFKARLKRSPDFQATFCQLFAFPEAPEQTEVHNWLTGQTRPVGR